MIYDFNFKARFSDLLPPNKRLPVWVAWMGVFSVPLQWLHDLFFTYYSGGSLDAVFDQYIQYAIGDRVRYLNAIYEAIEVPAIGNYPTDINFWIKRQDNWIGLQERIKYTSQKILLEYALNRVFLLYPSLPFAGGSTIDQIYITNNTTPNNPFIVGATEAYSSAVYETGAYTLNFVVNSYSLGGSNFTINVPSGLASESQIRNQADKYVLAGIIYNVIFY